jgi:hypothetical protein
MLKGCFKYRAIWVSFQRRFCRHNGNRKIILIFDENAIWAKMLCERTDFMADLKSVSLFHLKF